MGSYMIEPDARDRLVIGSTIAGSPLAEAMKKTYCGDGNPKAGWGTGQPCKRLVLSVHGGGGHTEGGRAP